MKTNQKRVVKMMEDPTRPGGYKVEIWIEGQLELTFNFPNRAEAQQRYDDERQLRGF
jgi:hypothetical protein